MRKVWQIMLNDLRVYFADRGNIIGLVALPIGLTLLLGFAIDGGSSGPSRFRIDLLDFDETATSAQFVEALRNANDALLVCPLDADIADDVCRLGETDLSLEQAQERVRDGITRALIVIAAGYEEALQDAQPTTLEYYSLANVTTGDPILPAVQTAVQRTNAGLVAAQIAVDTVMNLNVLPVIPSGFVDEADEQQFAVAVREEAEMLLADDPVMLDLRTAQASDDEPALVETQGFGQAVPGQGTLFVMFTVFGGLSLLLRERKQWTLQRLVVMPVSRAQILGGKILAYFALGMIQYAVVFTIGFLVGTDFGNAPFALVAVMAALTLSITALTFALATFVTTEGQASGLALLLSLTLAPLGGAWWPLEITPDFMQFIGRLTPVAWAMEGFRTIIFFGGGLGDILLPLGVLLGMATVFFAIGIYGFRYDG